MSWTLIEHQALTSSVASVTLGSGGTIPQTYKTLKLIISSRSTITGLTFSGLIGAINGTTANLTTRNVYGTGSNAQSNTSSDYTLGTGNGADATASTFGSTEITFPNYSNASANKSISIDAVSEHNSNSALQILSASLYANNSAITSINVSSQSASNFVSGSTFTLYGLA